MWDKDYLVAAADALVVDAFPVRYDLITSIGKAFPPDKLRPITAPALFTSGPPLLVSSLLTVVLKEGNTEALASLIDEINPTETV